MPGTTSRQRNARGAVVDAGSFARLFRSTQSNHILNLQCKDFIVPTFRNTNTPPPTPYPLFPTYPRTVRGPRASAVLLFYTDQMNRVHSSEQAPRSFKMAPCIVVERLEGKQRCSRSTTNPRKQPIMQSRQRGAQTTPAHLHWCRADPPSSWPAQAVSHGVNAP